MRELKVAMTVLVQVDEYLFQLRGAQTENGAVGKIGCFGGQINEGEEADATASRELKEKTGLVFPSDAFRQLGTVAVESDRDGEPALIRAEVFEILLPQDLPVKALQGELKRMNLDDVREAKARHLLTPATAAAFGCFYGA
jgi:ADP-ribose pyrophosphatase YjhB (NUDIX family)